MGLVVQREQIVGLDFVRFMAALAVAMYHLGGCTWLLPADTSIRRMVGVDVLFPEFSWMYQGWIGVEIFFVISGVVIAYSAQRASAYKFAVGRIVRMAPALWICASLTACVLALDGQPGVWPRYVRSMIFFPAGEYIDPSHWTLAIELAFYAVVFLLIAVNRRHYLLPVVVVMGAVSAFGWIADFSGMLTMPVSRTSALVLLPHGVFFALGVILQAMKENGLKKHYLAAFFIMTLAGIFEIIHQSALLKARVLYPEYQSDAMAPILFWLLSLALIAASLAYNRTFSSSAKVNGALRRLGLVTYPLYLLNAVIGAYILGLYMQIGISQVMALFLALATCVLAAFFVAEFIEPRLQLRLRSLLDKCWSKYMPAAPSK